jgi:hypothetical protein
MPRRCAPPSGRPWRIPTIRVAAKATLAPPRAATSSSSSTTTARLNTGTSQGSSSATCASMTICRSAMWVRLGMSHKPASCATCSIRRSTRSDRWSRRSRFAAMPPPGWRSFRRFRAFTWKARNTGGHTTGPFGAGIASAPKKLSKPSGQLNQGSGFGRLGRRLHLRPTRVPFSAALDQVVPVVQACAAPDLPARTAQAFAVRDLPALTYAGHDPRVLALTQSSAALARRVLAGPDGHLGHVPAAPRGARVDLPTHANPLSRSIERGGL